MKVSSDGKMHIVTLEEGDQVTLSASGDTKREGSFVHVGLKDGILTSNSRLKLEAG